jgi:tetratricopeptide (TPR) repeat protein
MWLDNLGKRLSDRYTRIGKTEDLEEAISHARRAVEITPQDHPNLAIWLNNLGNMLSYQYARTDKTEDLEEAISHARRAVEITPQNHPALARRLNNLGNMLSERCARTSKTEDLEEAISYSRRAVEITPQDHPDLAGRLNNLGNMLKDRYARTGKTEDLEEAISRAQRAFEIIPKDHPDLAMWLNNLSVKLSARYARTGMTEDLEEAISHARRAVEVTPQDHPDLAGRLNNLSVKLSTRYARTGKTEDLEAAISHARRAVEITPQDHPDLAGQLNNLGNMLSYQYARTGKTGDLEEAISHTQRAVDITPQDHPALAGRLNNLSVKLSDRYAWTSKTEDLEEAISHVRRAVEITPQNHPDLAMWLNNLGNRLSAKDRKTALDCYLSACDSTTAVPLHRIKAARQAIQLLVEQDDVQKASEVAEKAVKLLPLVCSRYLSRNDQQHAVSQTAGLAADACSLSLRADDDSNRALEYLEQGRGLIIGYLIDGRGDVSELRKVSREKADEFERLRYKAFMPIGTDKPPEVLRQLIREREAAATDLQNCLRDIRGLEKLPNHDRFLLPPSSDDLKSCATDGPIVIVNVTNISSDALIVTTSEINRVQLPKLDRLEMDTYRSWSLARGATRDGKPVGILTDDEKIRGFLNRLWSSCVQLVLERLSICEPPSGSGLPRIWWIGTGLASSLPFHAAGDHSNGSVANTLSCAISSYTPTIKALRHAREKARVNIDKHSILLVTMAKTPGGRDLPGVEAEEKDISSVVKDPHSVLPLKQPSADTVLDRLKDFSIAHFACHGSADLTDPSNSFLALQGNSDSDPDKLTVQMISDANLGQAWLAYLSACSTAEIKVSDLADEVLHLATSFQVAGFGHVVASMWPSNDAICAQVARLFYQDLLTKGGIECGNRAVPAALHAAVAEVRSQNLERPYLWAQYIHSGA